jgi:hypothetical protein
MNAICNGSSRSLKAVGWMRSLSYARIRDADLASIVYAQNCPEYLVMRDDLWSTLGQVFRQGDKDIPWRLGGESDFEREDVDFGILGGS